MSSQEQKRIRNILFLLTGVTVGIVILFLVLPKAEYSDAFPKNPVHWHMPVSLNICGKKMPVPEKKEEHRLVHGHKDGVMHVEGRVRNEKSISLGEYFDSVGVPFSKTQIDIWKNGDTCPDSDTPATVHLRVNGKENMLFRDYVPKNKDSIEVVFE